MALGKGQPRGFGSGQRPVVRGFSDTRSPRHGAQLPLAEYGTAGRNGCYPGRASNRVSLMTHPLFDTLPGSTIHQVRDVGGKTSNWSGL